MNKKVTACRLLLLTAAGALLVLGLAVFGGAYDVAATRSHWPLTERLLTTVRERSIARGASDVSVPPLEDPALLAEGAQHYDAMCLMCHLGPGVEQTEARAGLNPRPADLARRNRHQDPARDFWIVKHGIRMTGMPAWGSTHDDASLWGIVAFLRKLPELSAAEYADLVARGAGHSHAGAPATPEEQGAGDGG
ncbi:MAG: cytochrome c, partial [Gammaproteobacteria bacterium]|nr:cytochrome c [Gammaproteobacteria bacterium]